MVPRAMDEVPSVDCWGCHWQSQYSNIDIPLSAKALPWDLSETLMMKRSEQVQHASGLKGLLWILLIACSVVASAGQAATPSDTQTRGGVVFHLDTDANMNRALRQVARQVDHMPNVEVRVVLIASGVNAAIEGAVDANGGLYSAQIEQLLAAGVRLFACETTMLAYNISDDDLAFGIETVPSGIVELTRLQLVDSYAYQKL